MKSIVVLSFVNWVWWLRSSTLFFHSTFLLFLMGRKVENEMKRESQRPKRMNERSKSGLAGLTLGGLVAAQPHGNQPKEKTSSPLELSGFTSRGAPTSQTKSFHPNQSTHFAKVDWWRNELGLSGWLLSFGFLGWSARGAGYGRSSANGSAQEKTSAKKETKGKESFMKAKKRERTNWWNKERRQINEINYGMEWNQ